MNQRHDRREERPGTLKLEELWSGQATHLTSPTARAEFTRIVGSPSAARKFLADRLDSWGCRGRFVTDSQLVVSELATNAVLHARSGFEVTLSLVGARLRLGVRDWSVSVPRLRDDDPNAESGRGLQLVSALSECWGVDGLPDGKVVWAEVTAAFED